MIGLTSEEFAKLRVLSRDAGGAGVEMALAHHHAAQRHQSDGAKAELLSAEETADHNVAAPSRRLAIHLNAEMRPTQIVVHQRSAACRPSRAPMADRRA